MSEKKRNKIKSGLLLAFALIGLISFFVDQSGISVQASKSKKMPEPKMVLDDPDTKNSDFAGDKGKTPFDHDQHVAKDSCVTCHHTNSKKLTKAVEEEVLSCDECHKADDGPTELEGTNEDNKFKGKTAINAKDAYHGTASENPNTNLAGCINCHKTRNIPPIGCNDCHNG